MSQKDNKIGNEPRRSSITFERVPLEDQLELYLRTHEKLDLGDNWEDDLRKEIEKKKKLEPVPPLNELIDLKYKGKPLYWTERFLTAKNEGELKQVILEGLEWTKR